MHVFILYLIIRLFDIWHIKIWIIDELSLKNVSLSSNAWCNMVNASSAQQAIVWRQQDNESETPVKFINTRPCRQHLNTCHHHSVLPASLWHVIQLSTAGKCRSVCDETDERQWHAYWTKTVILLSFPSLAFSSSRKKVSSVSIGLVIAAALFYASQERRDDVKLGQQSLRGMLKWNFIKNFRFIISNLICKKTKT